MAHGEEKRDAVRHSYVNEILNLTTASAKHRVPESTARRWKIDAKSKGDCWDLARAAARKATGPAGEFTETFIEEFALQVHATFETLKEQGDSLPLPERTKILKQLQSMYGSVMELAGGNKSIEKMAVSATVIKELGHYISRYHAEHTEPFVQILDGFGPYIAQRLSE
ncbi:DUF1804 family protein [Pseudoalteromonas rubra]|uniref:DUF1804 family protein n=1 Tax=Pseudoalteromonas rubra TaxID=43658 RepID=UPI002DBC3180|nr:DUF1804 family protein [Pseudoalteromonas rubra]MEC4091898.1 DUF1804 family protein [Pseudoalteromonas rubra]